MEPKEPMADNRNLLPPSDNTDWFQRHILEKLDKLEIGQERLATSHEVSSKSFTDALTQHTTLDYEQFAKIAADIEALKPTKYIVYAGVAMILVAVFGAMIFFATGLHYRGTP
jgi:hypothetical protein